MSIVTLLPEMAYASAIAAGISKIATEQLTWNRVITLVKIPAPMTCAKFTSAATVAYHIYNALISHTTEQSKRKKDISRLTLAGLMIYAMHAYFNPDKSIRSLAILSTLAVASKIAADKGLDNYQPKRIVPKVTQNLPKSIAAAGISWLISRQAGFDPQIMLMTTLFQSVVYYASEPFFDDIPSKPIGFTARVLTTLGVTMAYRSAFNITTPLYEPFVKTSLISAFALGGVELLERKLA